MDDQPRSPLEGERVAYAQPAALCGVEILRAENSSRLWRVYHETYSMCAVLPGRGPNIGTSTWKYGNETHIAQPGSLMMMQPGEVHTTLSHTAPGTFRVLFVQAHELECVAQGLDFVGTPNLRMGQLDCANVHRTFLGLHESIERDGTPLEQQTKLFRCLESFLEHCTESRPGAAGSVAGPALARAREYIHAYFCEQITLDEIAKNAGASPFHLDRTFSAAFGAPMHAYLLLLRVNAARHLLRRKSRPVDVAGALGFADQAHFTRTFKRMVGVTPNNYVTATRQR